MSKDELKLFVGLLGQVPEGELVENHRLELVVAKNIKLAKEKLLKKWKVEHVHLDGIKELNEVDGCKIKLEYK